MHRWRNVGEGEIRHVARAFDVWESRPVCHFVFIINTATVDVQKILNDAVGEISMQLSDIVDPT